MLTRNRDEIAVVLHGEGRQKLLSEEELGIIIDTRSHFPRLLASAARRLDATGFALLIAAAAKSASGRDCLAEKKALFEGRVGFKVSKIRVEYRGKTLEFDAQEKLLMQLLYQIGSIFVKNSYMAGEKLVGGKDVVDAGTVNVRPHQAACCV